MMSLKYMFNSILKINYTKTVVYTINSSIPSFRTPREVPAIDPIVQYDKNKKYGE